MFHTRLDKYNNSWYHPGRNKLVIALWYIVNAVFFCSFITLPYSIKNAILRLFGAKVGKGVCIKPRVNIKYPWRLSIGDYTWVGENAWIDNLDQVNLGKNVCISQGALLLCGNHNYKKETFDLMIAPINIEDGAWIGAKAVVCPGVHVASHAVLTVGSIATKNLEPYSIHSGNPAVKIKNRI
ncbi:MAG TPA: WcaF family extracellular polysaccharide biosynthesis acetyltransferase [Bacteroidales bacterium]|nr:WcaF family extracellular polysaccharide biosynthesis acetyltransferase [Bacteroidales bacterium]